MSEAEVEQRLADLEKEVATLRTRVAELSEAPPWWERIAGTFHNDPVFQQAMELGRKFRQAKRPKPNCDA